MNRIVSLCFFVFAALAPSLMLAQGGPDEVAGEPAAEEGLPNFGEEQPTDPSDGAPTTPESSDDNGADEGESPAGPEGEAEGQGVLPMPLTAGIQFGVGCLAMGPASLIGSVLSAVPVVGFILNPLVTWALVSGVVGVLGDSLGPNQGTWLWPGLAGFCTGSACMTLPSVIYGGIIATLALVAYAGIIGSAVATLGSDGDPAALMTALATIYTALAGAIIGGAFVFIPVLAVGQAVTSAAVTGTYWYTSEPKEPGDGGFGFPGFFSPRHAGSGGADDGEEEPEVSEMAF